MIKQGWYKHFKGGKYFVEFIAIHSETKEEFVIYYSEYDKAQKWARPIEMFLEKIKGIQRFEFIGNNKDD